jgi:hypothetical protein
VSTRTVWLVVWFGASAALVAALVLINVVAEFRRLRAGRIPRPGFVLWKRFRGAFLDRIRFVKPSRLSVDALSGRRVWLSWDIRWGPSGDGLARVESADPAEERVAILLALNKPMTFFGAGSQAELLDRVRFDPSQRTSPDRYLSGAVHGVFRPIFGQQLQRPGLPTGTVVVYEELAG